MKKLLFILSLFITSIVSYSQSIPDTVFLKIKSGGGNIDSLNVSKLNGGKIDTSHIPISNIQIIQQGSGQPMIRGSNDTLYSPKINGAGTVTVTKNNDSSVTITGIGSGTSGISKLGTPAYLLIKVNDSTYNADTSVTGFSGLYPRRKDSTISFVTPYQNSLKQNVIQNLGDTSKYAKKSDSTIFSSVYQNSLKQNLLTFTIPFGIFYNNSSFTNITDFLDSGGVSPTVSGGEIIFTNGGSTYNKTLGISQNTMFTRWTMTAKVKPTGTSNGIFIGVRSSNSPYNYDVYGKILLDGSGNNGQLTIIGNTHSVLATSATNLTISTNDFIILTIAREGNRIIFSAKDITTNSASISVTYLYDRSQSAIVEPNTGRFSVGGLSSTANFNLDSLNVNTSDVKHASMMVIGDSKSSLVAGLPSNAWVYKLSEMFPSFNIQAASGDKIADVINRLPVIDSLYPQYVLLNIGRNDISIGTDSNTIKANYSFIVNNLQSIGAKVYHLTPIYEPTVNQVWFNNWISRTFSTDSVINVYNVTSAPGLLGPDNIHPNYFGHKLIFNTIMSSFKLNTNNPYQRFNLLPQQAIPFSDGSESFQYSPNFGYDTTYNGVYVGTSALTQSIIASFRKDQNAATGLIIKNFTSGSSAQANLYLTNSVGTANISLNSPTTTPYGIFGASTFGMYNPLTGGVSLMADNASGVIKFASGGSAERWRMDVSGNFTNTGSLGTAYINLKAGTASVGTAPLKYTAGVLLTTPESGANETDATNNKYYTNSSGVRAREGMWAYKSVTTTYNATDGDYTIDCTGGGTFTVTLPTAIGIGARPYWITNSGTGTITIATTSSQTFTNVTSTPTTLTIVSYGSICVQSNGTNWIQLK